MHELPAFSDRRYYTISYTGKSVSTKYQHSLPVNRPAYEIITTNTCPSIDPELLLVCILDYAIRSFLYPQGNRDDDAVAVETCLICKNH